MIKNNTRQSIIIIVLLAIIFCIALYLRVWFPYKDVFGGSSIRFLGNDPYYHMRLIDTIVNNFPNFTSFDPYLGYPGGNQVIPFLLLDYLIAGIVWLMGFGSPTPQLLDSVSAWMPAILGSLTIIPVFFIGRELFNSWTGLIAAGLLAIMPGEFLGRTVLGITDHHAAETLFSTLAMLFYIKALRSAVARKINYHHILHFDWKIINTPIIYSLLAGFCLGLYLLSWQGALFFVFIIFVYLIIQFIVHHMKGIQSDYLCIVNTPAILVTLLLFLIASREGIYVVSLLVALATPLALSVISLWMMKKALKPVLYPVTLVGIGVLGFAAAYLIYPSIITSMLIRFGIFMPSVEMLTIMEAQPIFFPGTGDFTLLVIWRNFTTGFFFSLIALGLIMYLLIKRDEDDKLLFAVWSVVMLIAMLAQRRFSYYFSINVALLTACIPWAILQIRSNAASPILPLVQNKAKKEKIKHKHVSNRGLSRSSRTAVLTITIFLILALSLFNISEATTTASQVGQTVPDESWMEVLDWLNKKTPEPFGNADFYYRLPGGQFKYPDSFYSVAAWWDYGYWITRIGHRVPNTNPGQAGAVAVGKLFTSQDESVALAMTRELKSKYFVVDYQTATVKFYSQAIWAGSNRENYFERFYEVDKGIRQEKLLFYPAYYQSLVVRLYNFDASGMIAQNPIVIGYQSKVDSEGKSYKEITSKKTFKTYKEADDFIKSQKAGNYRIVGDNPFISIVTMPTLQNFKPVFASQKAAKIPDIGAVPLIKVFECTDYK